MPTRTQQAAQQFVQACGGVPPPDVLDMALYAATGALPSGQADENEEEGV
jgi:hypothetical protein